MEKHEKFCHIYEGKNDSIKIQLDSDVQNKIEMNRQKLVPANCKNSFTLRKTKYCITQPYRYETDNIINISSTENNENFCSLLRFLYRLSITIIN